MPTSCLLCLELAFTSGGLPLHCSLVYLLPVKVYGVAHGYWDATTLGLLLPETAISQIPTLCAPWTLE